MKHQSPIDLEYPSIEPVPHGTSRPFWSVMIPTYNCTTYLAETLKSVLEQDLGPELMQIEVIDNCSTIDDPKPLVEELGRGRISFHRHSENIGAIGNFNSCIQRSRGEVVHILHSDDYVAPGFYEALGAAIRLHPDVDFFACRTFDMDEQGEIDCLSPRMQALEHYPNGDFSECFQLNIFRTPGVVIRRRFYEKFGGYTPKLPCVDDWEMWMRALSYSGGLLLNKPLAYFRHSSGNITSSLRRRGDELRDILLLGEIFASQNDHFDQARFNNAMAWAAFDRAVAFLDMKDLAAAKNNAQIWWESMSLKQKLQHIVLSILRSDKKRLSVIKAAMS